MDQEFCAKMIICFCFLVLLALIITIIVKCAKSDNKDCHGNHCHNVDHCHINTDSGEIICHDHFSNVKQKDPPDDDIYIIYSLGNSSYQEWQGDLLDFSVRQSGQPGTIIRLISDDSKTGRKPNSTKWGYTLITPNYADIDEQHNWPFMNKPGSTSFLFQNISEEFKERNKNATLIFLDPDMIFTKPWIPEVKMGQILGQTWKGYGKSFCTEASLNEQYCPELESQSFMYPFSIKLEDMNRIYDDIEYYSRESYLQKEGHWMTEMAVYVNLAHLHNFEVIAQDNIGLCNDWNNNNNPDAPIMHYCQTIKNKKGEEIWGKRNYNLNYDTKKVFDPIPNTQETLNRVDYEVLTMINKFKNNFKN